MANCHAFEYGEYWRKADSWLTPVNVATLAWPAGIDERFTQAETVKLAAVLTTGVLEVIWLLVPLNTPTPPDQVTFEAVTPLPVPDASATAPLAVWFSFHQAVGEPGLTVLVRTLPMPS